jgi:hypothetical protein
MAKWCPISTLNAAQALHHPHQGHWRQGETDKDLFSTITTAAEIAGLGGYIDLTPLRQEGRFGRAQ